MRTTTAEINNASLRCCPVRSESATCRHRPGGILAGLTRRQGAEPKIFPVQLALPVITTLAVYISRVIRNLDSVPCGIQHQLQDISVTNRH